MSLLPEVLAYDFRLEPVAQIFFLVVGILEQDEGFLVLEKFQSELAGLPEGGDGQDVAEVEEPGAVEQIVLEGFDIKAENSADSSAVKPVSKALDGVYDTVKEIKLSPLSWNVIRFKK